MLSANPLESQTTLRLHAATVPHTEDRDAEDRPPRRHTLVNGRYELDTLLGVGGGGSVYRARDTQIDDWVAIKIMHPTQGSLLESQYCFAKEVRLSQRVQHRNVARTFDTYESDGIAFMTMELIDGESLRSLVRPDQPLPRLAHVFSIGLELCRGLSAIHAAGVVHCDLKPDNILLSRGGRVVITDFGVARELSPSAAEQPVGDSSGTPEYMAPEQMEEGTPIDTRADLYSLGVILYELITGLLPFVSQLPFVNARSPLVRSPPDPRRKRPELPAEVAQLVMRCMAGHPDDRYQSAAQLGAALHALLNARTLEPTTQCEPRNTPRVLVCL